MTTKKLDEQFERDWKAAEDALRAAQMMPGGPERIGALRRAGQLRYDADKRMQAIEQEMDRSEAIRRLVEMGPKAKGK
jgi:hypothetical protein